VLGSFLAYLENKPVWDTATRDTLGNTIPKTALTRTKAERMDVGISQVGNTVAFVGGGLSINWLLRKTFEKFQSAKALPVQQNWAVLSRSIGIYSAMVSSMWAMPFIRNYITTKRTGMVNYADVIKSGGTPKGPQTPEQKAAVAASLKDSQKKALTILGGGAAGIILPAALGYMGASRKLAEEGLENLFKWKVPLLRGNFKDKLLLGKGEFDKLGLLTSILFWGIPAYIGWYHASRDPYEKKEVFVRCADFVACFSLPPILARKAFAGKFKQFKALGGKVSFEAIKNAKMPPEMAQKAKKLLIGQNALGMGSSIVLLGVTPQLLNIILTKRRMAKEAAQKGASPVAHPETLTPPVAAPLSDTGRASVVPAPSVPGQTLAGSVGNVPGNPGFQAGSVPQQSPLPAPVRSLPSAWPVAGLGSPALFR
jgi:hypothetical protein